MTCEGRSLHTARIITRHTMPEAFSGGGPTVYSRRRAREPEPRDSHTSLVQLLPVAVLVLLSMMSGFFISEPVFSLTANSKYPVPRETVNLKVTLKNTKVFKLVLRIHVIDISN
ncbi:hypothetical protein RR48_00379 [Papilio machaon]|uniref:Uncharacterized protein n=1 Tax=Papilio machaon TaxID=76193 RepID=A0A0N0PG48_PAPMA|nr:hypothetical protein RR48_00379 [Papilio machaon]